MKQSKLLKLIEKKRIELQGANHQGKPQNEIAKGLRALTRKLRERTR